MFSLSAFCLCAARRQVVTGRWIFGIRNVKLSFVAKVYVFLIIKLDILEPQRRPQQSGGAKRSFQRAQRKIETLRSLRLRGENKSESLCCVLRSFFVLYT